MLIAVEGCLGAGKTTVAAGLAARRNSALLLEDFEANPFLRAFYRDPDANALETEFCFLLLHYHQLRRAMDSGPNEIVADFHLGKDVLFAELNLQENELRRLFLQLYSACLSRSLAPQLLLYLAADTDLILDRIKQRSRDLELEINAAYYASVNSAYDDMFARYSGPKLRIDMSRLIFRTPYEG